mmetsp:Transcript_13702/g.45286  ORF Transcript_13702/g.45286 Transcript_13702/m.45286 type:complete len:245 (-) Transcript_13702:234-968(-)
MALVYSAHDSNNSGARYHRVTTYSVMKLLTFVVGCWPSLMSCASPTDDAFFPEFTRANPKSQIFKSQFAFRRRLLGFKSRCSTFALWMYFNPRNSWYTKYWQWSSERGWFDRIIWCKSVSISSYITYTSLNVVGAAEALWKVLVLFPTALPGLLLKARKPPPCGATTSAIRITFSCFRCLNSLISRKVRLASTAFSKALLIFLIATRASVFVSRALHTTPYAPLPIGLIGTYFLSISNKLFQIM